MKNKKKTIETTLLVHFCNFGEPYLELYFYRKDALEATFHVPLSAGYGEQSIADAIAGTGMTANGMYLLLSDRGVFKTTSTFPKLRRSKTDRMYRAEQKAFLSLTEKYRSSSERYEHALGVIYYTYYTPEATISLFERVAALLKCKFMGCGLFVRYLQTMLANDKQNYLFYYAEYGQSHLLLSYGGVLSAFVCCPAEEVACRRAYFSVIGKHFFELERQNVDCIYAVAPVAVPLFGRRATWIKVSFEKFLPHGVRL